MIKRIWLYPPLAFARVGSSSTPCENFYWGPDDLSPQGTARTQIIGAETLEVAEDGTVTLRPPSPSGRVVFKDGDAFRPVCPFFELHAAWDEDDGEKEGPVTEALLGRFGLKASDLTWQVEVVNLKAFHLTGSIGDRVAASVRVKGNNSQRHTLNASSPVSGELLVPPDRPIPFGSVQATRPTDELPEFRLRFTPPAGKVYAPTNILERVRALGMPKSAEGEKGNAGGFNLEAMISGFLQSLLPPQPGNEEGGKAPAAPAEGVDPLAMVENALFSLNSVWRDFKLPADQCVLNPAAAWPKQKLVGLDDVFAQMASFLPRLSELRAVVGEGDLSELIRAFRGPRTDVGNLPPSVFAYAVEGPPLAVNSLGMVDDTGDGTISVELGELRATSRVVVAPPSFAPDRRLPVSIADGLADRVDRQRVRDPLWVAGDGNRESADAEVHDLLDRAYETAGLQNADAMADFFRQANRHLALRKGSALTPQQAEDLLWNSEKLMSLQKMPLSTLALQRHRRNTTRVFFEIFAQESKGWFERWIRPPAGQEQFTDKRMPGLMRGFDRHPLHLTRRQYELLKAWSKRGP